MNEIDQVFNWPNVQMHHFYIYFILATIISLFIVIKSGSKHKLELFFISFYLLTGNVNKLLTIELPGISLFEIQPIRFLYLLLLFFIIRKTLLSRNNFSFRINGEIPWFIISLLIYVLLLMMSLLFNSQEIEVSYIIKNILDAWAFVILIFSMQIMADTNTYNAIGKSFIIAAVFSSIVSIVQLVYDPFFLRIGDDREAFGNFLRSNGLFETEYFNSYFLIIAIVWVLATVKNSVLKNGMVLLFSIGIITTFQRMSWIILFLVITIYLFYIKKLAIEKMLLIGLASSALILSVSIFYFQDIKNSSLVRERLSDSIDGRKGYYGMVLDNIGKKPLLGYGHLKNDVYYEKMLIITRNRSRATADSGDLHSGYFSALFLYGIPAFIFFVFFVLSAVRYYLRLYTENSYYVIPLLVSIIYVIGNFTNNFLFLKYLSILYALHIGIGLGLKQLRVAEIQEN